MFIAAQRQFTNDTIVLKYSQTEIVKHPSEIQHRIFRQVLTDFDVRGLEITSMADIPAGTGLGSSSSFTVALLKVLYAYKGKSVSNYKVAKEACEIEIEKLGNPIGKQDQFAAAFGGLRYYEFEPGGFVKVEPIIMSRDSYRKLENSCLMFFTGSIHNANEILGEETKNLATENAKINATLQLCEMTRNLREQLELNNVDALGDILNQGWEIKKTLASGVSNSMIDTYYQRGIEAGAKGGKLLGAGGGGFLLFYVPEEEKKAKVREALKDLKELPFELDNAGVSIVFTE